MFTPNKKASQVTNCKTVKAALVIRIGFEPMTLQLRRQLLYPTELPDRDLWVAKITLRRLKSKKALG